MAREGAVRCQVVWTVCPPPTVAKEAGVVACAVQPLGAVSVRLTLLSALVPPLTNVVVAVTVPPAVISGGAARVSEGRTTIGAEPLTPLTVTGMVAVPSPTALTSPGVLTVAPVGLLLLYLAWPGSRLARDS